MFKNSKVTSQPDEYNCRASQVFLLIRCTKVGHNIMGNWRSPTYKNCCFQEKGEAPLLGSVEVCLASPYPNSPIFIFIKFFVVEKNAVLLLSSHNGIPLNFCGGVEVVLVCSPQKFNEFLLIYVFMQSTVLLLSLQNRISLNICITGVYQ